MKSKNNFQKWLELQGYYRITESRLWYDKDGKVVTGAVLAQKLQEWENL